MINYWKRAKIFIFLDFIFNKTINFLRFWINILMFYISFFLVDK